MATGTVTLAVILVIHGLLAVKINVLKKAKQGQMPKMPAGSREDPDGLHFSEDIQRLAADLQDFISQNKNLWEFVDQSFRSSVILKDIGRIADKRIWLTNFTLDSLQGHCELEGSTFYTRAVSEFMMELKKLPYFKMVSLTTMERGTQEGKEEADSSKDSTEPSRVSTTDKDSRRIDFKIHCQLNKFLTEYKSQ